MADKPWKRVERQKCRALGGERSGPTGRDTPDCNEAVHVALEIKYVKNYTFLTKYWEQAVENAAKVGKIPVLNVKETGRNGRDRVQLRRGDLAQMLGHCPSFYEYEHHHVNGTGECLVRMEWWKFVLIYRAAYIDNEEKLLGS